MMKLDDGRITFLVNQEYTDKQGGKENG